MGNTVMPFLYTVLALNGAVVAVAPLRYRNLRPGRAPGRHATVTTHPPRR